MRTRGRRERRCYDATPARYSYNSLNYIHMDLPHSHDASCPHCGQSGRPMVVSYTAAGGELAGFSVDAA